MSQTEYMGVSPSQVSCHTKSYSSPKQTTPEQTPLFGADCMHGGMSEYKDQVGPEVIQTSAAVTNTAVSKCIASKPLQASSKGVTGHSVCEDLDLPPEDVCKSSPSDKGSNPKLTAINQKLEFGSECGCNEVGALCVLSGPLEEKAPVCSEVVQTETKQTGTSVLSNVNNEADTSQSSSKDVASHPSLDDATKITQISESSFLQETALGQGLEFTHNSVCSESMEISTSLHSPTEIVSRSSPIKLIGEPPDYLVQTTPELLRPIKEDVGELSNLEHLKTPARDAVNNSNCLGGRAKRTPKSRKKYMLRSSVGSDRVLRSRSREKPKAPESSSNLAHVNSSKEDQKKKRKKRQWKRVVTNEHSKIRADLRYSLNRMNYEQSLIIAYSGEGWKGLSLEKLKPEKELQRATSEIFRRKLKIRDLFQRIDSLCAEGKLPASLFDSEGQISSEDIFCAKCGSKDFTADNDIILCDGACDRGFHQFCLVPPLLKEDIPPDDEGWLCPGCDCKVDCIDLLNESQGTNIAITDSWQKVFPEAAAAAAETGQNLDNNDGLPSDDSDDNDYDPDGPESDEKSQGDESSSDESDFTSASDELVAPPDDDQYLGLPSDDPEDDDYDPKAPLLDEKMEEDSSSDFTSDSEDLAAAFENNESFGDDKSPASIATNIGSNGRNKLGGKKNQSLRSELSFLSESDPSQDVSAPISARRNVERLDYKKLYDETYGNVSSDSNDDEDFTDKVGLRKRRRKTEVTSVSANGIASVPNNRASAEDINKDLKDTENFPERTYQKLTSKNKTKEPAKAQEGSPVSSSSGKRVRSSAYKRLGEATTQRLHESFRENQYPDKAVKESLANELGITLQQVSKWFENARWSYNHSSSMDSMMAKRNQEKGSSVHNTNERTPGLGPEMVSSSATGNGARIEGSPKCDAAAVDGFTGNLKASEMENQQSSQQKSATRRSTRRKHRLDSQESNVGSRIEEAEKFPSLTKSQESPQLGGRMTRSKKPVA